MKKTLIMDAITYNNEAECCIKERALMDILKEDIRTWKPAWANDVDEIMAALEKNGSYKVTEAGVDIFVANLMPNGSPFGTLMATIQCWGNGEDVLERTNTTYIELPDTGSEPKGDAPKPCVVMMHTFDSEVVVYEYPTQEAADEALVRLYTEYLETEKKEGSHLNEGECFCRPDEGYAKVTWADGEVTDFVTSYITKEVQS